MVSGSTTWNAEDPRNRNRVKGEKMAEYDSLKHMPQPAETAFLPPPCQSHGSH